MEYYMNDIQSEFIDKVPNEIADELLVYIISDAMKDKLEKKRKDGRGGWFREICDSDELLDMLNEHILKGDMIDVINLAAMIYVREKLYE